jgi:hypothetical protein
MKTATQPSEALDAGLGPDLSALIETVGVPVVEIAQVTTIRGDDGQRGTFRLTFADGRMLKARRLRTASDVERVTRLTARLEPEFFPPVPPCVVATGAQPICGRAEDCRPPCIGCRCPRSWRRCDGLR